MSRSTGGRDLDWDGCWNARDLGGLPTVDGRRTRWGAVVRSDHLHLLSPSGWVAARAHGIRTVVDLRTSAEADRDRRLPPPDIATVPAPLEDGLADDPEFASWTATGLLATPLYYVPFLRRWPERAATAVAAVAQAAPGGVIVHCSKGCDRTGMIVTLLLTLCGVAPQHIVADYALTAERLRSPRAARLGRRDDREQIQAVLEGEGYEFPGSALQELLASFDIARCLRAGGLTDADSSALRARLLEMIPPSS